LLQDSTRNSGKRVRKASAIARRIMGWSSTTRKDWALSIADILTDAVRSLGAVHGGLVKNDPVPLRITAQK
jgi:hypothetical protein